MTDKEKEWALSQATPHSAMGDVGLLAASAAAVKAVPLMLSGAKNLLKKEVADMTISNAALKAGRRPELTRHGIKNWKDLRIHNAFLPRTRWTPGGTLQTLPTKAAWTALGLGGGAALVNTIKENPLGIRDTALNTLRVPEHYKRFAQYLTGGVEGDVINELPRNILLDVVGEHVRGAYPDRDKRIPVEDYQQQVDAAKDSGNEQLWYSLVHGQAGMRDNPNYDPESTLLSTYGSDYTGSKRTLGSLGHLNFVPEKNDEGKLIGYRIKDTWDVDPDPSYKAWKSPHHKDLIEGGVVAARAHDIATKLGTAKKFKYDVFIPIDQYNELENEIKSKSQFQRKLETSKRDKFSPSIIGHLTEKYKPKKRK